MSAFPVAAIRAQFPALGSATFLDNPGGTQVPERVIQAVAGAMRDAASNYGGYFAASQAAESIHAAALQAAADLLGASTSDEILIGQSMTMLTFQMARSLTRAWGPGDEIIVTRMDHEGNVSPWLKAAEERGITVRWLGWDTGSWRLEPDALRPLLSSRTRLVALNHASNLTGSINPIAELAGLAREAGALSYVDAVQFAPHGLIDVQALGCDFLVCSAYKFFGPHLGVLWGRAALLADLPAYAVRCADPALPTRHATGTPQTELLAGLSAAIDYLADVGVRAGGDGTRRERLARAFAAATSHERALATQLIEGLATINGVQIRGLGPGGDPARRVPTVSFTHARIAPERIAQALAERGINVWSGHNYAWELVRTLGLERTGVLRIGLAHYNDHEEVGATLAALRTILA